MPSNLSPRTGSMQLISVRNGNPMTVHLPIQTLIKRKDNLGGLSVVRHTIYDFMEMRNVPAIIPADIVWTLPFKTDAKLKIKWVRAPYARCMINAFHYSAAYSYTRNLTGDIRDMQSLTKGHFIDIRGEGHGIVNAVHILFVFSIRPV